LVDDLKKLCVNIPSPKKVISATTNSIANHSKNFTTTPDAFDPTPQPYVKTFIEVLKNEQLDLQFQYPHETRTGLLEPVTEMYMWRQGKQQPDLKVDLCAYARLFF
jgi:hypothetical protein